MATKKAITPTRIDEAEHPIDEVDVADRNNLALEATWELEGLLLLMIEVGNNLDAEELPIRGLAIRAKELNSMVMSVLGGDTALQTGDIYAAVRGLPMDHGKEVRHG